MLGSAALPQLEDGEGNPGSHQILSSVSMKFIRTTTVCVLQGVIPWVEESFQAQCFTVLYILVWLRLFKERWKIPDMNLLPELLAQSFLLAGDRERRGYTEPSKGLPQRISLDRTALLSCRTFYFCCRAQKIYSTARITLLSNDLHH